MDKIRQIVFTGPNTARIIDIGTVDFDSIGNKDVVVKTHVSTISPGTERANLIGGENLGPGSKAAKYPRYLGYSSSGIVVAVGSSVKSISVGDKVAVYEGHHKNYNIVNEKQVVKIENDSISMEDAAIAFIAAFPLGAIRKVNLEIGESLMVMGLGILGQLAVKLASAAGACPIIACDPIAERRELALKSGADYAFNPLDSDFSAKVKAVTAGGVKTAIEVTGVGAGLNETLDCMAKLGRVALLGCTRNSNFSIDYYQKVHCPGITLIGAHTSARAKQESSRGNFTHADDIKVVLNLCAKRGLAPSELITEMHNPEKCGEVYERLINDKSFPVGVQFDWRLLNE